MMVMSNIYGAYLRVFRLVEVGSDAFIALFDHRCIVKCNCLSLSLHVIETAIAAMEGSLLVGAAVANWVHGLVEVCGGV